MTLSTGNTMDLVAVATSAPYSYITALIALQGLWKTGWALGTVMTAKSGYHPDSKHYNISKGYTSLQRMQRLL